MLETAQSNEKDTPGFHFIKGGNKSLKIFFQKSPLT